MAEQMGIENMARSRKQDVIFALLKKHAKSGEEISGDGVLEILQDGFGFLRSAETPTWPARTISTSRPARSAVSTCAPATPSLARSAHRRKASVTSPC
jgi:transcription termination factor Rho